MSGQLTTIIISVVLMSGFISCTGKYVINNSEQAIDDMEGWISDDTFQIAAGGIPVQSLKLIDQRKESARLDAILNAQCQILVKFSGVQIKRDMVRNDQLDGVPVSGELKKIVKEGIVKKTVWDYNENCEIIFEVKHPGLKMNVTEGKWN